MLIFLKFPLEKFIICVNIELEHVLINPLTNITIDDLLITTKMVLTLFNKIPNYLKQINEKYTKSCYNIFGG